MGKAQIGAFPAGEELAAVRVGGAATVDIAGRGGLQFRIQARK